MADDFNVEIRGTHMRESAKAQLVDTVDQGEIWFPKSQMSDMDGQPQGEVVFFVPEWLARKNGFIE